MVSGSANVTIDGSTQLVTENESIYIPIGAVHALENPGKISLELIEVQSGAYLGEDNIVRFSDRYGRIEKNKRIIYALSLRIQAELWLCFFVFKIPHEETLPCTFKLCLGDLNQG